MPRGPNGERRPTDGVGRAVMVARIATGEIEDDRTETDSRRRPGGVARAAKLTPEQRSEIARKAAAARWRSDRR